VTRLTDYFQSSPAAIFGDTVIVGGSIDDRPLRRPAIPGDVRAYDARTGVHRWTFRTVPDEGDAGSETWLEESWRDNGAANVWGPITVDVESGTVFLTTSTPTNDFYGGHRPGDGLFGESLVALDAETGEPRWHRQLVHHGLWDYDPGAAANLAEIEVDGRAIDVVAQVTKQGFTFVFDRATGEPVWPIEERPVPSSDVPGERASPTQPFPTRPPPFELQGALEENLIDFTPELRAEALDVFDQYRTGPLFTPPSVGGTIILPGTPGGSNWRGAGVDPETGILFVPSIRQGMMISVKPGDDVPEESEGVPNEEGDGFRYVSDRAEPLWFPGGRYSPDGLPLFKPPYSSLTAIDLNRGEILWQVPVGEGPRDHPRLAALDLPPLGSGAPTCVLVTKTLVMAGEGAHMLLPKHREANRGEPLFYAFDKQTGAVVGRIVVPGKIRGCPMTYEHGGRQLIVFSVGDRDQPAALVALALPE
jgi:quinoprotein glucose dehydrogenase